MNSHELRSIEAFIESQQHIMHDALERAQLLYPHVTFEGLDIHSWPQLWSSTSCGFGGISGAAMTTAQTTVVFTAGGRDVLVYHAGRFAYHVKRVSDHFMQDMQRHCLLGAANRWQERYEEQP